LAAIDAGHTDGGNDRGSSGNAGTSYASNASGGSGADQSGVSNTGLASNPGADKTFGEGTTLLGAVLSVEGGLALTTLSAEGLTVGEIVLGGIAGGSAIVAGAGFALAGVFIVGVSHLQ
jgi:hypothetical protein